MANIKIRKIYVPSNLSIVPEELMDAAQYICHRIYVGRKIWNRDENGNGSDYTNIKAEYLRAIIRDNHKPAINWLTDNGIIEWDGKPWVAGVKSYGYRWMCKDAVRVNASPELSMKMTSFEQRDLRSYSKAHRHLFRYLPQFKIDYNAAISLLSTLESPKEHLTTKQWQELMAVNVNLINDGIYELNVCNYGRFHSPFTSITSKLRPYLSFNNKRLFNTDIRNSQPLLLGIVCLYEHLGKSIQTNPTKQHVRNTLPYAVENQKETVVSTRNSQGLEESSNCTESWRQMDLPDDLKAYLERCEAGTLYEYMMEQFGWTGDRGTFKKEFFRQILFGPLNPDYDMVPKFRSVFPTLWKIIRRKKKGNYAQLAWEMQRAESRIIIDSVGGILAECYPEVPAVTIHDSYLTTEEHADLIVSLIAEQFAQIGFTPSIKKEGLNA